MTILANYHHRDGAIIPVEIVDADARSHTAKVRALNCEPFTHYTMGGPMTTSTGTVWQGALSDIELDPLAEFINAPAVEGDLDPVNDLRY